jgi:LysR family transcriptional regulator, mexEF-oprN operon transcriptional activator
MMRIDHANLARLDLNLLVALDALLAERSVTRASARIGIGQSAMSHNLARLRLLFDDELLTRVPNGMRPTPRGLALIEPVQRALAEIQELMLPDDTFDPATADRVFRIGVSDSVEVALIPTLLAHFRESAPGIRLQLRSIDRFRIVDELDADRLDLGIGVFTEGQTQHKRRRLYTDKFLCMFNAELVGVSPPISLDDYVRLPHVLASLPGDARGIVDDALAKLGLERRIVLTTQHLLAVPFVVRRAPVITTMRANVVHFFAEALGLEVSPPPVELLEMPVSLLWHASNDRDPAHRWLRQTVTRLATENDRATL